MSELVPPHVITNIFSRLPVKSLLRFRCVSKPIRALIDSPHFTKSHLHQSFTSSTNQTIITASVDCTQIYSMDFDLCNGAATFINHPFIHCGAHFLASCNGFILLLTAKSLDYFVSETVVQLDPPDLDLVLVNPATRNYKLLLVSPIEYPPYCSKTKCWYVSYGLGYDSVLDDYKVVRIAQFPGLAAKNEVKIFSLKMNSWRRVKDFPYCLCGNSRGFFLNGSLHWLVTIRTGFKVAIIATFDLGTEKYGSLPQPHYSDKSSCMLSLGVLGGKLCLNRNYDMRYIDLWVMEKYGVKKSWSKILSVAPSVDYQFMQLKPLAYSNNGKKVLLLDDAGQLIWYDLEMKVISRVRNPVIPEFSKAYVSLESLVKVRCDASTALPRVQRKTKKSKLDDFLSKAFNPVL